MAYLAVNKDGTEKMFKHYPFKGDNEWMDWLDNHGHTTCMEQWKDIDGYNGRYQISLEGRIRSFQYNKWQIQRDE